MYHASGSMEKNKVLFGSEFIREEMYQIAGVDGPHYRPGTDENDANYFIMGDRFDVMVIPWLNFEIAKQAGETAGITKTSEDSST